jgi:hypothetical protein
MEMVWPINKSVAGTSPHILGCARNQVNEARLLVCKLWQSRKGQKISDAG